MLGRHRGLAAPLVAGAATAVLVSWVSLDAVADLLPRWLGFAVLGLTLVVMSAHWERGRARVAGARGYVRSLR